ncbi:helix-turn-helix transcriptional regulator [Corynebacterium accolens]|uniref:helix-turn-helix domain-containing protein n=1 Tax=Corynebacterium accolens TaxID=38284 RepID=UPI002551ACE6|nr:helix-turn-helix transcriptional regulator [Corynebacterium accolens]MDK8497599.1 helix-turn-helix transcriptional regulator [Corynebacterium accolens]
MTDTRWWRYLQELMGGQTQLEAARFIGISKSNITRWKDGARAAPDFVVKVARAYNANVLEALVEAEFITEEEAQLREINVGGVTLSDSTNEELLKEILSRSDPAARYLFGNDGDEDTIGLAPHLAPVPDVMGEMPEGAVAYDGPDEDAERGFNDD